MPRKRNRPRKASKYKKFEIELRNFARGKKGSLNSAAVIKELSPLSRLKKTATWFARAFYRGEQVAHILPKEPCEIPGISISVVTDLEREIIWTVGLLYSKLRHLKKYITEKKTIETFLSNGNYKEAEEALFEITKNVCWSHTSLALKLHILSETYGLESQKDWIRENIFKKTNSPSAFFAYCLGVRQETGRDPQNFENYITQSFPNIYLESDDRAILQHILMAKQANSEDEPKLIQQLQTQSLVDMYEGLVAHLIQAVSKSSKSLQYYTNHLLPLMDEIGDIRTGYIKAALGDEKELIKVINNNNWSASRFANEIRGNINPKTFDSPDVYAKTMIVATDINKTDKENKAILGSIAYSETWNNMCSFLRMTYQLRFSTKIQDVIFLNRSRFIFDQKPCSYLLGYINKESFIYDHAQTQIKSNSEKDYFDISSSIVSGNYENSKNILSRLAHERGREDPEFLRLEIILSFELSDWSHIIDRLYDALEKHKESLHWLPYFEISKGLTDEVIENYSYNPKLSIVLSHLVLVIGEPVRSKLVYSSELYLDKIGFIKPSEIETKRLKQCAILQEFVFLCFTPDTMALSLNYDNAKEMQDERIKHLTLLSNATQGCKERFENEIEQLIRSQEIARAMSTVAESKIDCDEKELFSWAREKMESKYERFRSFVEAGILPAPVDASRELLVAVREGDLSGKTFEIPSNEATNILREITSELIRGYSLDPYFGLNSYLSLRVRHGTISGQLRRGCAEEKLLTTVDGDGDRYEVNQHWLDILSDVTCFNNAINIADRLAKFSKDFDELICNFSEENLQIYTNEKPKGLVITTFSESTLFAFFSDAISLDTFDDFLENFSTIFWANLENNLEITRNYINNAFRSEVMSLFNDLEQSIQAISKSTSLPPVSDAIVRAKKSTNQSIDEISNWFFASRISDSNPFSIPDLGRISLEIAKRLDPGFNPDVSFEGDNELMITSGLITFTDVFGVLFDNAAKHSGYNNPKIKIKYTIKSEKFLRVIFSSNCNNIERAKIAAENANKKFSEDDYSTALTAEGGTGLAKLSKIIQGSESTQPFFVSVDNDNQTFDVNMEFTYLNLRGKSDA